VRHRRLRVGVAEGLPAAGAARPSVAGGCPPAAHDVPGARASGGDVSHRRAAEMHSSMSGRNTSSRCQTPRNLDTPPAMCTLIMHQSPRLTPLRKAQIESLIEQGTVRLEEFDTRANTQRKGGHRWVGIPQRASCDEG
jgi:hypothetical protein